MNEVTSPYRGALKEHSEYHGGAYQNTGAREQGPGGY